MGQVHKVLILLPSRGFRADVYQRVRDALELAGFGVAEAAPNPVRAVASRGDVVYPDFAVDQVRPETWDALLFLADDGVDELRRLPRVWQLAQNVALRGGVVGALGAAVEVLALAGLLAGRRATGPPDQRSHLEAHGARLENAAVVAEGNVVTGRDASVAEEWAEAVVAALHRYRDRPRP
ncbi:MAG TPA: DJ-1/PfpI family protein [Chloroflexota bacterium]